MYDAFIDILNIVWRYGFKPATLVGLVILFLKTKMFKKKVERRLPWLFKDDSEVKPYVQNQMIIMENQRRMMERMGVEWYAPTLNGSTEDSAKKKLKSSLWHSRMLLLVLIVKKFMKFGGMIMSKLKSRKFILAVVGAVLIILNDGLDLGIQSETVLAFAGLLATWIVGESAVDVTRAKKGVKKDELDYTQDTSA